jgi:hypothetical protein
MNKRHFLFLLSIIFIFLTVLITYTLAIDINYIGYYNGANLTNFSGERTTTPYGSTWGNCIEGDTGIWDYVQAICDRNGTFNTRNNKTHAFAPLSDAGSTWSRGNSTNAGIMIIDLNQTITFNELIVFQMFSDGKVTEVQLFENYSNPGVWTSVIGKSSVGVGYGYSVSGGYMVTNATDITFSNTTARHVMLKFWNNGSYGSSSYIEVFSVKLFGTANATQPSVDTTYPSFSGNYDNNASIINSGIGIFNITVLNSNGSVLLDINNTNITATNLTLNTYNASYNFTSSGVYAYRWHSWGNGTSKNYNLSSTGYYTVNVTITDTDSDGIQDSQDNLEGNESYVTTSGISNLNITINGNLTSYGSYNDTKELIFYDSGNKIINFTHNFTVSQLELRNVSIIKGTNYLIVNLSNQIQPKYNKTIYITDNDFIALCVKDAEISSINDMSSNCNGINETEFTSCLNGNSTINGTICKDEGSTISISNLRYSAVRGTPQTQIISQSSQSHSSDIIKIISPGCYLDSDCKENQYCSNSTCFAAQCLNDSSCNTQEGETCWNHKCVKLFDMEILEFSSPIKLGDFFNFKYFVKAVAEINGDVEIDFWIEKNGKKVTSGKDTIYMGGYEQKTKEKQLFLPSDVSSGVYDFFILVSYGDYTAKAHRTVEISVNNDKVTMKSADNSKLNAIFASLFIVLLIISAGIFYDVHKRKEEKKELLKYLNKIGFDQKNIKKTEQKRSKYELKQIILKISDLTKKIPIKWKDKRVPKEKIILNSDEKMVLTLLNKVESNYALDLIKKYSQLSEEKIEQIIDNLLKDGLLKLEIFEEKEGIKTEMYIHTNRVKPRMLDEGIRFKRDMGWDY